MAYSSNSNAVVFEAAHNYQDERAILNQRSNPEVNFASFGARGPVQPTSENNPTPSAAAPSDRQATRRPLAEISSVRVQPQSQILQQRQEDWIQDPYFVLGVEEGATEAE